MFKLRTLLRSSWPYLAVVFPLFLAACKYFSIDQQSQVKAEADREVATKQMLASSVNYSGGTSKLPSTLEVDFNGKREMMNIQYAFDQTLQDYMESEFRRYSPDYGAFVAVDASTGRVLSLVSYDSHQGSLGNLALRATFPSASVFKVVTAAAAIEERRYSGQTVIPFFGSNHTLYRKNVLNPASNRWTRYMTLKEAFAKSVNPVFGKLGAFALGANELKTYASKFGFNRAIGGDLPIQEGQAPIVDEAFSLAEAASGFTRSNTMSPLQGALIAAAIANDGVMMEPYAVDSMKRMDGIEVYAAQPKVAFTSVGAATALEMRKLMRETILRGTSRGAFRKFFKGEFSHIEVGGKSGSLTGDSPAGKYDWFIGYAGYGPQKIAFASMIINKKFWTVKSSHVARMAIENYFRGRARVEREPAGSYRQ